MNSQAESSKSRPIGDEATLVSQQKAFSVYCKKNGHQPTLTFEEHSYDSSECPRYGEMLDYLKQSRSQFMVVIAGSQHLGDSLESSVRRILELDSLGAKVVCSDDHLPDPLQHAIKQWQGTRVGGSRAEHIKEAMMAKALRGEGLGKPPFGYKVGSEGRLEILPHESETVRLIFNLYAQQNMGMRRIVNHLNERGIATRGGRGWSIVTIRDILRNRAHLGTYTRFGMRVPRNHQAIITSEEFSAAQQKMGRRKPPRASRSSEPFLLSGLAYCEACGNRMIGVNRRQPWRRKDGSKTVGQYRYYQCQSRANQGMCGYHTWRASDLEERVLEQARLALETGSVELLADSFHHHDREGDKNDKRLGTHFLRAVESAAAGIITLQHLRSELADIDAERASQHHLLSPESPLAQAIATRNTSVLTDNWDSLDKESLGLVLHGIGTRVVVGNDSVKLTTHSTN